jgi:hypothetical protein
MFSICKLVNEALITMSDVNIGIVNFMRRRSLEIGVLKI